MILHSRDAIDRGYKRLEVYCRDTEVLLLLIYHFGADAEVYMISGTGKQQANKENVILCTQYLKN